MKICVLGLGYIGLPTALLLATNGHKVVGVDINDEILKTINKGIVPFNEHMLSKLLKQAMEYRNFTAKKEVDDADVFLIAVPTPLDKEMNIAELKHVQLAAEAVYPHLKKDNQVILEPTSFHTSPVGLLIQV